VGDKNETKRKRVGRAGERQKQEATAAQFFYPTSIKVSLIRVWNVLPISGPPFQTPHLRPTISGPHLKPPSQASHLRPSISDPPSQTPHLRPQAPHLRPSTSDPTLFV